MKLLMCNHCGDIVGLSHVWRECACGEQGGMYNSDGDTVTVTQDAILFGFCNHLRWPNARYVGGEPRSVHAETCSNAWEYPENEKVARLSEGAPRPTAFDPKDQEIDYLRTRVAELLERLDANAP